MKRTKTGLGLISAIAIVVLLFAQFVFAAPAAKVETITVSAAASLQGSLTEIQKQFEASNKNIKLQFNFGASGTLKKQIEEGAPVDLFIAADTKSITDLDAKKLVVKNSIKNLLGNELVLLVNKECWNKVKSISDLTKADVKNISIGVPESVPAGAYAKESFTYYRLWDKLSSKFVYGKDVKQVMTYVETGDAMAGVVYFTDAKLKKNSIMVQLFPSASHSPILYGSAVVAASTHRAAAQQFLNYLGQQKAQDIFRNYGFRIIK